jgi:hypothetical protein
MRATKKSKSIKSGKIISSTKNNVYAIGKKGEKLRAVSIGDHWRLTKYVSKGDQWKFVNGIEYKNAYEALRDKI